MLFRRDVLDGILAGRVDRVFRRWDRPHATVGGTQRTVIGVVEFTSVEVVDEETLTEADAVGAGFADLAALLKAQVGTGSIHRIGVRFAGADPRVALREQADLTPTDRAAIAARLERLDASSSRGAWTELTLHLIAERPAVRAPDLAASLRLETLVFKRDVRKLKELGLTESLDVGYRLSPRGIAYLGR